MNKYLSKFLWMTLLVSGLSTASTILPMNRAFTALTELLPFIQDQASFLDKANEPVIEEKLLQLDKTLKTAKHETLLKHDLFAPSYALITENISESVKAFKAGKKSYSHWMLQELTTLCLDCHTRMPESHASSFQSGELQLEQAKFKTPYSLATAQLIVRRYTDAKNTFLRDIQDKLIKKDFDNLLLPFQQILLIDTKVQRDPEGMEKTIDLYLKKETIPDSMKKVLKRWNQRLVFWKKDLFYKNGIRNDQELKLFIKNKLTPLKKTSYLDEGHQVDFLMASGLLSHYFFINQDTQMAPEISYWLGLLEKRLKRSNFFGSGDYFLKQCIRKYPQYPAAKECLNEYKESVEFDFSGSGGTLIPPEVQKEIEEFDKLLKNSGTKPKKR